jgi:general secretion pathway protein A
MYTEFYGLNELPFQLTPDPRFLFLSASHQEALAQMLFGIQTRRGFVVLTGEVGTGKTTLIRALLKQLEPGTRTAYLYHAIIGAKGLFQFICREYGIATSGKETKNELIDRLSELLLAEQQSQRPVVLIIDEAQNLKPHILEEIRLISNLETTEMKLIQILLVGQPEFDRTLDRPEMRQLKQRVALRYHLIKLDRTDTERYIHHRLQVAGYHPSAAIFPPESIDEIYHYTHGLPRAINILCDNALIMGYSIAARRITPDLVRKVEFEDMYQELTTAQKTIDSERTATAEEISLVTIETRSENLIVSEPLADRPPSNGHHQSLFRKIAGGLNFFKKRKRKNSLLQP